MKVYTVTLNHCCDPVQWKGVFETFEGAKDWVGQEVFEYEDVDTNGCIRVWYTQDHHDGEGHVYWHEIIESELK